VNKTDRRYTEVNLEWDAVSGASGGYQVVVVSTNGLRDDNTVSSSSSSIFKLTYQDLAPNTQYTFSVRAARFDSGKGSFVYGRPSDSTSTYTNIEQIETYELSTVQATSLGIRTTDYLSNLSYDLSGWRLQDERRGTDSGWKKDSNVYTFPGLIPNTSYWYRFQTRNAEGVLTRYDEEYSTYTRSNDYSASFSTYTWAIRPKSPSLFEPTDESLRVKLSSGGEEGQTVAYNSAETVYSLYNNTAERYVSRNGELVAAADWATYEEYGGTRGVVNRGLQQETAYSYKVAARSSVGIQTLDSADSQVVMTVGIKQPGGAPFTDVAVDGIERTGPAAGTIQG
jgi:hypothetical protein